VLERCIFSDEMLPNKKTGEFTGLHKVATVMKYVLETNQPPGSPSLFAELAADEPAPVVYLNCPLVKLTIDQFRI
jgi:hypothetical protein